MSGGLSPQLRSIWAKSNDEGQSLSLVAHGADACAVMGHLWDTWVPDSVRRILMDGRSEDEALALAKWLAASHDVGKASPAFACQVPELAGAICDTGLDIRVGVRDKRPPHSVVGQRAIERYLVDAGWQRNPDARSYAVVAGSHHGVPPEFGALNEADAASYGDAAWDAIRSEYLDYTARISGAGRYLSTWKERPLTPQQQVLWTGVVILADWLSSDSHRFPLGVLRNAEDVAAQVLSELDLPAPWRASPPATADAALSYFNVPAGAKPNGMQIAALEASRSLVDGGLLIIEAEMGSGKTEAALMAAEQLASLGRQGGLYVALPTMATSNAMFSRVLGWLRAHPDLGLTSIVLAHGKADLNDDYRGLFPGAALSGIECDGDCVSTQVIAHQWLSGRKKSLLANFAVGTIDQLLFMGLKSRHFMLRHLAFAGKVVVIDEVHAADHYMREYLIKSLEWLGAYAVPVIMLSATLPSEQRVVFARAYARGRSGTSLDERQLSNLGYPAVTAISCTGEVAVTEPAVERASRQVQIVRLDDDDAALIAYLSDALRDGGCVAVVRNTVRRAQETTRVLREVFGSDVFLLHASFVARHRVLLEEQLLEELGRDSTVRPRRRIVVATQVVEQSLDCDFDAMVTDLAPIDILFQRLGRVHRHRRTNRGAMTSPTLCITGVQDWSSDVPAPIEPSANVYYRFDLLRALGVLYGREYLSLPSDITELVQAAYSQTFVPPAGWEDEMASAKKAADESITKRRSRAKEFQIREPHKAGLPTIVEMLVNQASEVDDPTGYARVRDGNDSIEVILVRRIGSVVYLPKQCGIDGTDIPIEVNGPPSDSVARKALSAAIRLPFALSLPGRVTAVITELERRNHNYQGWRQSRWLKGELALELDERMETELCGFMLRYDDLEGLVVSEVSR